MTKKTIVPVLVVLLILPSLTNAQISARQKWKPQLTAGMVLNVVSPGGDDQRLFEASMGWGLTAQYWLHDRTQITLSGWYAKLQAREDEWYDRLGITETFDVWDVEGNMMHGSVEIRRLYPASYRNFLYIGLGADIFWFDTIEGKYEIYQVGLPIKDTISDKRDPSLTGGIHFTPGMMFLFKSFMGQMFIDVGVKLHYIMDGDTDNPLWINPAFTLGLRVL